MSALSEETDDEEDDKMSVCTEAPEWEEAGWKRRNLVPSWDLWEEM